MERSAKMAKLYYRYGAMNSGKTRDLMKVYYNYKERKMNTLVMKPAVDIKGKENLVSRDGASLANNHLITKNDNVYKMIKEADNRKKIHCILIDEAQFMHPKNVDELAKVADYLDIPVICYGLRADFRTKLFPGSRRLFEIADSIEEIKTVCECGRKATMNTRMVNGKYTFTGSQVAIDGEKNITYNSLCRKCYQEKKNNKC